jgi:hypothetical protein
MDNNTRRVLSGIFENKSDGLFEDEVERVLKDSGFSPEESKTTIAQAIEQGLLTRTEELRDAPITPLGMEGCRPGQPWMATVLRATPLLNS